MAFLRGIETLAIGKQETVSLYYEGAGLWVDKDGKEVKATDAMCYDCMTSFYVLDKDPIDFCPHCGYRNGKSWAEYEKARSWAMKHDWEWMRKLGRIPVGCRRSDGSWLAVFAPSAKAVANSGKYVQARELLIDDREVAETGADGRQAGVGGGGGRRGGGQPGAFGGGGSGDDWGLEID
ncbi:MAG: hypothetical protein KC502_15135 [Myxococcales bacterium]|nr:hypothetical protein [Myxococcales bacterium]